MAGGMGGFLTLGPPGAVAGSIAAGNIIISRLYNIFIVKNSLI
jgi:hypothetical protein